MNHQIIMSGTYKDRGLRIKNGKFAYFGINSDSTSYIKELFYFDNNIKTGLWTEYDSRGKPTVSTQYLNNEKNGRAVYYFMDTAAVRLRGYYKNGLKTGKWYSFNKLGDTIHIESWKEGKQIGRFSPPSPYIAAKSPKKFSYVVESSVRNLRIESNWKTMVICNIDAQGNLTNASINDHSSPGPDFKKLSIEDQKKIEAIMLRSEAWVPAYDNKLKSKIPDVVFITISQINKEITTSNYTKAMLYNW